MIQRVWSVGLVVSLFLGACAAPTEAEDEASAESNLTAFRAVDITVSAQKTGENYEARSYPNDDFDGNGQIELYNAPVYKIFIDGVDDSGQKVRKEWTSPRFMPFYNDPKAPSPDYKSTGFINSGLHTVARQAVPQYKPDYEVHNRFSPFGGAIVVKGTFYIHAGPAELGEFGWGSAGCVEIIGNFDNFKKDILDLAGSSETDLNKGMSQLVAAKKLFVKYETATPPQLKSLLSRQVGDLDE